MPPNPTDGSLVTFEKDKQKSSHICIFTDKINVNNAKFNFNLNGDTTVKVLYEIAGKELSYDPDSFLICYLEYGEYGNEILVEPSQTDQQLNQLLSEVTSKRKFFNVMKKDEKDPIITNDATKLPVQSTDEPETYFVGSLFSSNEKNDSSGFITSDSYSSSYNTYSSAVTNTRSVTGFVGLVNQAMTCYLNSLIQTLFMTPEFRNALYRLRIARKDETSSIPYQLQKLFLQLETSKKRAVETTGLTKSFGWESGEAWQQHDVQELCRVMFDKLEETLKGTDQEDLINQLYQGELKDYVNCLKCGHENSRKDNYLDISVDIRPFGSQVPHKDLEEALRAFVTPETLSENNQYFCEKCKSKQDAHKGLKFLSFPYLLTIQLKRFTFDFNTLQRTKLPDKLTFPFEMDLNELIEEEREEKENVECDEKKTDEKRPSYDEQLHLNDDDDEKTNCEVKNDKNIIKNSVPKGPYIYELFSVLIHSGSAVGGHYYAYIKSFDDGKWYCFNDQYVSEISQDDLLKSYGGDRVGLSSYSSSTNAYMLMYRRRDPTKNICFRHQSQWSKSLQELCKNILDDEHKEHNRKQWEKNVCKLQLYAFHPLKKTKLASKLEVHKDATLREATEIAWKKLELEDVIPLEQCRIVKYDDHHESFEKSYEDCDDKPMEDILGSVRSAYGFDLLLECRKKDEKFEVYLPGGTTLRLYVIDLDEEEFEDPRILHVPLSTTIGELKLLIEKETGISSYEMRVAVHKEYQDFYILEKNQRTLKTDGFYKTAKLFVEGLSEEDREVEFKQSKFYKRLDVFTNSINLKITCPSEDESEDTEKPEINMFVDKRITLRDFKTVISKRINMDPESFRVFRTYSNNQEFECTRLDDQMISYSNDTKIIVKRGRALQHGETRIKLFHFFLNEKEHFKFFTDAIVYKGMTIQNLKEEYIFPQLDKENVKYEPSRVRLRKKSYKNPAMIYPDDFIFEENITLGHNTELYIETLEYDNEVTTMNHLSIYMKRWHPEQIVLDSLEEVVLFQDFTVDNLKKQLSTKHDIPPDFIHVAKGRGVFPCVTSVLDVHHDLDWNPIANKITDYPLSIKEDGGVIYFRDSREVLKKLTNDEIREIRNKERERSNSIITKTYRKEKALKIYTNGEKR